MSAFTVGVIDANCQRPDAIFYTPAVSLITTSTTTTATIKGWGEYIPSTPPKSYHNLTWSGTAEQTAISCVAVYSSDFAAVFNAFTSATGYSGTTITNKFDPIGCLFYGNWTNYNPQFYIGILQSNNPQAPNKVSMGFTASIGTSHYNAVWASDGIYGVFTLITSTATSGGNPIPFPISLPASISVTDSGGNPSPPVTLLADVKYTYSGTATIDTNGNQISYYTKNRQVLCGKFVPLSTGSIGSLSGYCNVADPNSCGSCSTLGAAVNVQGNSEGDVPGDIWNTPAQFLNNTYYQVTNTSLSNTQNNIGCATLAPGVTGPVWSSTQAYAPGAITRFDSGGLIHYYKANGNVGAGGVSPNLNPVNWTLADGASNMPGSNQTVLLPTANNFSAVLSNEYTLAEALTHATITTGNGATAQNVPGQQWPTGFTSSWTTSNYTVNCFNLFVGQDYVISLYFINSPNQTFPFTATTNTHTITGAVPTPSGYGKSITLGAVAINFAP